ncbi:MAG: HipA N-terminal domain-containing protein, partial [Candidatus Dormibacteraceae bacterium]
MADGRNQVIVQLDAAELGPEQKIGLLTRERSTSKSVISFAYERQWVAMRSSFSLDPELPLYEGGQYAPALPGIFTDAAPDRWGRTLLERREALAARREGRRPRQLDEWDFLVGVNDSTRMGALRFSRPSDGALL